MTEESHSPAARTGFGPAVIAGSRLAAVAPSALPWWRFGIVWFTLGLPAAVVVAAIFTAGIAWRHADVVVLDPAPSHAATAMVPAERARNHAATPAR